ncbi:peptidase S8/S53 domain-containing protein [Flagelloscypha sp. PMI_526]|nr:peptidase S8/S53 domain-containing protein [Flagelloscypha sp. PMI_526]
MKYTALVTLGLSLVSGVTAKESCEHKVKEAIPHPLRWKKTLATARYGNHMSDEDVHELIAPHAHTLTAVNEWLESHELTNEDISRSPSGDWARITVPLPKAELMLNTTYHIWEHETGERMVRTTQYSLPVDLHEHIEFIQPTIMLAFVKSTTLSGMSPKVPQKGSIGISSYLEQYINECRPQSLLCQACPGSCELNLQVRLGLLTPSVDGGLNDQDPALAGVEANLDAQYAFGLTYPIPQTAFSTAGRPPWNPTLHTPENTNEPYNAWLDYVLALKSKDIPKVIYGEEELSIPPSYGKRACNSFAQLGVKGVSVLFSSGDGGVGIETLIRPPKSVTQRCLASRQVAHMLPLLEERMTSPKNPYISQEEASADWFQRPWYQELHVPGYLKTLPKGTYAGLYNPKGRALRSITKAVTGKIGGTSASAPAFAALVALLNDARLAKGLAYPWVIQGCGTPGFNATAGWDPVTGLGTPNFGKLLKLSGGA